MSLYDEAYRAGKNGEDWYQVQNRYGNDSSIRNAFESGKSYRTYNSDNGGSAAFGNGLGMIMMLVVIFYMFLVIYSPLLAIGFLLLYPFFPSGNEYFGSDFLIYGAALLIIVYLLSCGFEYLRARMLEARRKNQKWKLRYTLIFVVRIIIPGIAAHVYIYAQSYKGYTPPGLFSEKSLLTGFFVFTFVVLMLLWKVKILSPDSRFFFTKWAFEKGVISMATIPVAETAAEGDFFADQQIGKPIINIETKAVNMRKFYLVWAGLTILIVLLLKFLLISFFSGFTLYFSYVGGLIFVGVFTFAAWPAKVIIDNGSKVYLQYDFADKHDINLFSLLKMSFFASLIMMIEDVRLMSSTQSILIYALLLGAQIYWKLRKISAKEEIII